MKICHTMRLGFALISGLGIGSLAAQRKPARCPDGSATPDSTWRTHSFPWLHVALALPAELRPVEAASLKREARRASEEAIPQTELEGLELVVAWRAPRHSRSIVTRVLLFTLPLGESPSGRPCSWTIAGEDALVFRYSASSKVPGETEYWAESYWPGYVLAIGGQSFDTYDIAMRILRSVSRVP